MKVECKICGSTSEHFGRAFIMQKYHINYYRCATCEFIQTEEPFWLEEAYSTAITRSDIGLINRNIAMAIKTRDLILTCFDPNHKFLDYGGGYGMFVRLMRDKGFDFYRYDPISENLFAQGFDTLPEIKYSLLTAWEVFEHLNDPLREIKIMLNYSSNLFFSTITLPPVPKQLNEWWYYGLDHGQHIAFYSRKTLQSIADIFGLALHFSDGSIHFIGEKDTNSIFIKIALLPSYRLLRKLLIKPNRPSLVASDYQKITGKKLDG